MMDDSMMDDSMMDDSMITSSSFISPLPSSMLGRGCCAHYHDGGER